MVACDAAVCSGMTQGDGCASKGRGSGRLVCCHEPHCVPWRAVMYLTVTQLQHPAVYCPATYCSVLPCTAMYCHVLQCTALYRQVWPEVMAVLAEGEMLAQPWQQDPPDADVAPLSPGWKVVVGAYAGYEAVRQVIQVCALAHACEGSTCAWQYFL